MQHDDHLTIPAFLDRTAGASRAEIDALRLRLNAEAGVLAAPGRRLAPPTPRRLSDADQRAADEIRAREAEARRTRTENRIARLLARRRPAPAGHRWDPRRAAWVPDPTAPAPTAPRSIIVIGDVE